MKKTILAILALNFVYDSSIAQNKESTYDYVKAFKTAFYSSPSTDSRSASGKPGHKYWQNRADYNITVELDTLSDIVMGKEIIRYTNNSPDAVSYTHLTLPTSPKV